jgi:recombination protein RecA
MTPPAAKTEAPAKAKAPAKKTTAKKSEGKQLSVAQMARNAILKETGQKPLTASFTTYPHVSSGSLLINDVIGGSMAGDGKGAICPGYPRRRITEIYGAESSGKTTAGLHAIAEAQRAGGCAMFLDFEHALHHGYAKAIGVSFHPEKLLLYAPDTLEEGFKDICVGILAGVDIIVLDSVAAMAPKAELERDMDKEDMVGLQARKMSSLLRRVLAWLNHKDALKRNPKGTAMIFINQPRADIKGGKDTTAGGKALKFYASLRLVFSKVREEVIKKKKDPITGRERNFPYGNHTQVKVVKNKMDARQGFTTDIFIRFGYGIDEFYSVIEAGVNSKVIKKKGAMFVYGGEEFRGREKFRLFLKEHPDVFKKVRDGVLLWSANSVKEMMPDEDELDDSDNLEVSIKRAFGDDSDEESEDDGINPERIVIEEEEAEAEGMEVTEEVLEEDEGVEGKEVEVTEDD